MTMTEHWFAIATKPRQEEKAETHLQRQGFTVFLPRLHAKKRQRDRWKDVVEPLFPGYLFIHANPGTQSLAPVRSTRGVRKVVSFGDQPVAVPEAVISFLQKNDAVNVSAANDLLPFRKGTQVEILGGPFQGLTGVYDLPLSEERVLLLVTLLGRCNSIEINVHDIVPQT